MKNCKRFYRVLALLSLVAVLLFLSGLLMSVQRPPSVAQESSEVNFIGTVVDTDAAIGFVSWTVEVQRVISGPSISGQVHIGWLSDFSFCQGNYDVGADIGDTVEVYGTYDSESDNVAICGPGSADYYFVLIEVGDIEAEGDFEFEDTSRALGYPPSQTNVQVRVRNVGSESVTGTVALYANGIQVGSKGFPDTGQPLPPTYMTSVWVPWNLGSALGKLEDAELKAVAEISGYEDINPANNTYTETVSIYWVDFPLNRDAYNFENQGYQAIDLWQDLRDLLPHMSLANYGQLFMHLAGYIAEWGGHCLGMSATSIVYRDHPDLRPSSYSTTYAIPDNEAWPMIRKYQRNQFLVLPRRLVEGLPISFSVSQEFLRAADLLGQSSSKPAELTLTPASERGGHSVVAYKAVRTESAYIMFIYDNNYPYDQVLNRARMITVDNSGQFQYTSGNITYTHFYAHDVNPLLDDTVAELGVRQAREWQVSEDLVTVFVGSPVDPLVVDGHGNRLGIVDGQEVSEIPGGQMWHLGGETFFVLPRSMGYSIQATGLPTATVGDTMKVGYALPVMNTSLLEVSFSNVPIDANSAYTTDISSDPENVDPIHLPGGGMFAPDKVEVIEGIGLSEVYLPLVNKEE